MTANEWLEVMKQASDFPKGMEKLIVKYGEMLIEEHDSNVKKLNEPAVSKCEEFEREASCKHSDWTDLYYSSGDYYGRYCNDCGEFFE